MDAATVALYVDVASGVARQWTAGGVTAGDIAEIVTAAVAVTALVYTAVQLGVTRNRHKRDDVYLYAARFYALDAIPMIAATQDFVRVDETERAAQKEHWAQLGTQPKLELMYVLNLFEQLGAAYELKTLDNGLVRKLLGDYIVEYWERASWFIEWLRESQPADPEDEEPYLAKWEAMKEAMKPSKRPQSAADDHGTVSIDLWDRSQMAAGPGRVA
jgi:hypothetical protein